MSVSEEIINRFLSGRSGEAEQAAVRRYFTEHPEELEKYMTEENWSRFHTAELLAEADSEKMLQTIGSRTWHRRRYRTAAVFRAVAAAVVLLAVSAGFLFLRGKPAKEIVTTEDHQPAQEERVNNTGSVMKVTLPDNTIAEIQPGGKLHYQLPFGERNREVHLEGQALFHVKSNAGKPFTVFAGNLGTTALGTVFSVAEANGKVTVQLLSGKVVVRAASQSTAGVYLKPGEKLYYDELKQRLSVEQPVTKPLKPAAVAAAPAPVEAPAAVMLQFENEPLTALFKTIGTQFGMQVRYEPGVLDNMYFTGVYDGQKESLADFLNTLALLNNVSIRINENIIYITP
jgi:ferric-dicitrate binding protein FerR (iron transport regulator)